MAGEWTAGVLEDDAGRRPPAVRSWEPVTVPGRAERFAGADAVAYRMRFPDPRQSTRQRAILDFRGLYGDATVYLNGSVLGTHDAYFRPARFEFEPADENELVVVCRRPTDGYGGAYETDDVPDNLAVPGIWWGVHLRLRPPSFLADLAVNARQLEPDRGVVDVAVTVDAAEAVDDAVTLSVRPENFRGSGGSMERVPVTAEAGERVTVTHSVGVREPARWWPADRGDPNRYTVRARFGEQERSVATGFRTIAFDRDDGLRVNGERVRARGVNVLPTTEPDADLERARDLNATLVRLHGHVLPASFYDAADDAGVFVAQDLPLTGSGSESGADSRSVDRGRAVARAVVNHVDHHPSVACYGVHDDPIEPFADRIGTGRTARYRIRTRAGRASVDRSLADAIADAFPSDSIVFPVCGPLGSSPDAAHLYPGWRYGQAADVDWLVGRYPEVARVVTEFGAGSLAATDDHDGDGADRDHGADHNHGADREEGGVATPVGLDREVHDAVLSDVGAGAWGNATASADDGTGALEPDGTGAASDTIARSQGTQARVLARVAGGFRRHGSDVLAAFSLRDVAAGGGMGVYAHEGTAKPAADALGEALAPVQVFLADDPPGATDVVLVNDAPATVSGTVSVTSDGNDGDGDGGDGVDAAFDVEADALDAAVAGTVDVPRDATVLSLSFETGAGDVTRTLHL